MHVPTGFSLGNASKEEGMVSFSCFKGTSSPLLLLFLSTDKIFPVRQLGFFFAPKWCNHYVIVYEHLKNFFMEYIF